MRRRAPRAAALRVALLTAALALPLAALARAPYTPAVAGDAVLRFSWRLSAPAQERCRARTAAELEALPLHMRTPEICERVVARYTLVTATGDARPDTVALEGGGVKGDRPLFVLQERVLPAGPRRVRVELWREGVGGAGGAPAGRARVAALDTVIDMAPGRVRLVTLEGAGGLLVR